MKYFGITVSWRKMEITLSYKSSKTNSEPGLKTKQFLGVTVLLFIFTTLEPLQWQISDLITTRLHSQEPSSSSTEIQQ